MSAHDAVLNRARQRYGTIIIVSGGCYGSYYHRQLQRAARAGAIAAEKLIVVDRDPNCAMATVIATPPEPAPILTELCVTDCRAFIHDYLTNAAAEPGRVARDAIVPSPLMPHLIGEWIVDRAREEAGDRISKGPFDRTPDVPWQRSGDDGTHYVSFATWMCPINCIEPRICPHTKHERTWSMPAALESFARDATAGAVPVEVAALHCLHRAYGVGMIDTAEILSADARVREGSRHGSADVVIGTVSHCHGALTRLVIGPPRAPFGAG